MLTIFLTGCVDERTKTEQPAENAAIDPHSESQAVDDLDTRSTLPEYKIIPAAATDQLTPANDWPTKSSFLLWQRSHGGPASIRYSALDQITTDNVSRLEVAWIYRSGDLRTETGRNLQANPLIVNGVMYAPTIGHALVAVNAATGRELWRFLPGENWMGWEGEYTAQRGLTYWPGTPNQSPRLYFTSGSHLYCLDAKTGQPVASFGDQGRTTVGVVAVAPAIYQDTIIFPSKSDTAIFGYDIYSGEQVWRFNTVPQPGERFYDASVPPNWNVYGWGGMALDVPRGIAFFGLSDPNFDGGTGPTGPYSDALFSNCVLALDAATGRYLWHFQEIRRDIWDMDIPSPPMLVTLKRDGKMVDAVAAFTKLGNTLVLDRVTGSPLFPVRLRRAPASQLPGVSTSPYQPDINMPEPFTRQEFTLADVTDRSPEARKAVMDQIRDAAYGWFQPFQKPGQLLVYYGVHGGAEWPGGCFDPETGLAYVSSNQFPWYWSLEDYREDAREKFAAGRAVYERHCLICHGTDRTGIGNASSLVGLSKRYTDRGNVMRIIKQGINTMPPVVALQDSDDIWPLLNYLYADGEKPDTESVRFVYGGMGRLRDHEGLPATKPPWGTLNAIDLNSGRLNWQVTLGEHPDAPAGMQPTGTENFGGPTVTAGGLVFCAGTKDHKIRAFDKATGKILWEYQMEFGGYAPPAVYQVDGRQFVVIAASSGGNPGGKLGDTYYAFALPEGFVSQ